MDVDAYGTPQAGLSRPWPLRFQLQTDWNLTAQLKLVQSLRPVCQSRAAQVLSSEVMPHNIFLRLYRPIRMDHPRILEETPIISAFLHLELVHLCYLYTRSSVVAFPHMAVQHPCIYCHMTHPRTNALQARQSILSFCPILVGPTRPVFIVSGPTCLSHPWFLCRRWRNRLTVAHSCGYLISKQLGVIHLYRILIDVIYTSAVCRRLSISQPQSLRRHNGIRDALLTRYSIYFPFVSGWILPPTADPQLRIS